jgi:WD40 repeat protein
MCCFLQVVDCNTVVLACNDHNLYGFDVNSGKKIYEYKGHVDVVTSVMPVSYWRGGIKEQIICSGGLDEHICIFGFKVCTRQSFHDFFLTNLILTESAVCFEVLCGQLGPLSGILQRLSYTFQAPLRRLEKWNDSNLRRRGTAVDFSRHN